MAGSNLGGEQIYFTLSGYIPSLSEVRAGTWRQDCLLLHTAVSPAGELTHNPESTPETTEGAAC